MTGHRSVLFVAAGGGGDALAALMVAHGLFGYDVSRDVTVATFAWERKVFDPSPGPRRPRDFSGLVRMGGCNWRIAPSTRLRQGMTFLPEIARQSGAQVYLFDPSGGAERMAAQLGELTRLTGATATVIVDAGGDILARGDEPGLRSPLADALALAAAAELDDVYVVAIGLGLDGELTSAEWRLACRDAARGGGRWKAKKRLPSDVAEGFRHYWRWHPSEVAGLACLAALGYEGEVEVRREGLAVRLDEEAAVMHAFRYDHVLQRNAIAQALHGTRSLRSAESIVRSRNGMSEIDFEREVVNRRQHADGHSPPLETLERQLLSYSDAAWERGIAYLTVRRIAEALDLGAPVFRRFCMHLQARYHHVLDPPVWHCDPDVRRRRGPRASPPAPAD